ncbi:MAG: hypothetical protein EHM17_12480 [Verrucomicrobiaceae bacterium]|nr:MAG: hypothetical protein EHM17_12480 [Verrucomicrobiaceae bacterium]
MKTFAVSRRAGVMYEARSLQHLRFRQSGEFAERWIDVEKLNRRDGLCARAALGAGGLMDIHKDQQERQ